MIKEEEERGYFRKTVSEQIEEESESRKLMKEMEKEKEEKDANTKKPGKCEDEDEGSPDKEKKEDKGGKEEGASIDSPLRLCDPSTIRHYPDSPTNIDAAIQNTNLNSLRLWLRQSRERRARLQRSWTWGYSWTAQIR